MSGKNNDSLEDFFRKATHTPDLRFNEADWLKLEKKLDEQPEKPVMMVGPSRGRVIGLIALAVALSVLTLMWWRGQDSDFRNLAQEQDTMPTVPAPASPENTEGTLRSDNSSLDNTADASPAGRGSQPRDIQTQDSENSKITGLVPDRHDDEETRRLGSAPPVRESAIGNAIVTGGPQPELPASAVLESPGFNRKQTDAEEEQDAVGDDPSGLVQEGPDQPVDSASAARIADALDTDEPDEEESRGSSIHTPDDGRFGISIVAAPDFSMTTNGGAMGSGEAVGIMLHYRIFNRWGITAGALHNTKKYWGHGSEYNPPSGYWKALTNGVVPDRVDGACALYEIPVSVTFDVVRTRRSRLFASAGLSSYIMRNEDYYYKFDTPNPGAVTGWSGDKPSALWFGVGILSAGYNFRATRSLSFGVEPYFKVPLEGVGWADIDLYSTGLMFSARYHFMKNGDKHPPASLGP